MFPRMFMRKPDKADALKHLRVHVELFGAWVAAIRVAPYVLHYFSDTKDELVLCMKVVWINIIAEIFILMVELLINGKKVDIGCMYRLYW
ncbi:mitochondrial import receptor subunit TOM6 [Tanacetum coccineum]